MGGASNSNNMNTTQSSMVLDYWFGPLADWDRNRDATLDRHQFWWQGGPEMDEFIREQFGELLLSVAESPEPVETSGLTRRQLAEQVLARIIVLSQFSRHIHRGTPKDASESRLAHWSVDAFAQDEAARKLSHWLHEQGLYEELRRYEKQFSYMPFVQSEVLRDQDLAVQLCEELWQNEIAMGRKPKGSRSPGVPFCKARRDVVLRFGRLPFRNVAYGRTSTPEELMFLRRWQRGCA